ncbi:2-phosphosulfolactate phosphatase [Halobacillus amylolyticus]|uniref:Probable 2-phosphosulfolactate phosphatase n=1 Tax=Halobacillus amylolyticus TaxID=2932259 RepID=A0ABY4HF81_9BACI|nr:2-phosphosulfolactate phosphatase [Halobacillus amylolyticus]UOR13446.1 2-phosphosulfolactate phosphatase [Halobacillus amylolyticus]
MSDIQVIFKKEDIQPDLMKGKVAVVFDVLFATSTITAALADGAASVIAVYDQAQAREKAKSLHEPYVLAGEDKGRTIDGFEHPLRSFLQPIVAGKHLVLSTTNGTVALNRSSQADALYASSLLNNQAMAQHLANEHKDDTIVLVCSGTSGHYTMEDFYGAGSLVSFLVEEGDFELSDAARTALLFYQGCAAPFETLRTTRIGQTLVDLGMDEKEIQFIAQEGLLSTIAKYDPESGQIKGVQ